MLEGIYNGTRKTINWCFTNSSKLFVIYLSTFSAIASGRKPDGLQCLATVPLGMLDFNEPTFFDPDHPVTSELFLTELNRAYTVVGNCELQNAEYILFPEEHSDHTQIIQQANTIPRLMGNSDYLLQEGVHALTPANCRGYYLTNNQQEHEITLTRHGTCLGWDTYNMGENDFPTAINKLTTKYYVPLKKKCLKNIGKMVGLMDYFNEVDDLNHFSLLDKNEVEIYINYPSDENKAAIAEVFTQRIFNLLAIYSDAVQHGEIVQYKKSFTKKTSTLLAKYNETISSKKTAQDLYRWALGSLFDKILRDFNSVLDNHKKNIAATTVKRDASLLATLQFLACNLEPLGTPCHRKIIIAGASHLPAENETDEDEFGHDLAPLEEYLRSRQYVILYPR